MNIDETYHYPTDPASVYALATTQAFREEVCVAQGSSESEVTIEEQGEGATVTILRTVEGQMPDFIAKFVGDQVQVKQEETWGPAADDGSRTADLRISIIGQPAEMTGTISTSKDSESSTSFRVHGEITVNVPFLGKKIEPEIAKVITEALSTEVELGKQRL